MSNVIAVYSLIKKWLFDDEYREEIFWPSDVDNWSKYNVYCDRERSMLDLLFTIVSTQGVCKWVGFGVDGVEYEDDGWKKKPLFSVCCEFIKGYFTQMQLRFDVHLNNGDQLQFDYDYSIIFINNSNDGVVEKIFSEKGFFKLN